MSHKKIMILLAGVLGVTGLLFVWLFSEQFFKLLAMAISPLFSTLLAVTAAFGLFVLKRNVVHYLEVKNKSSGVIGFGVNFVFGAGLFVLAIPVLTEFGVPTTSLITILGTSSLAIGLALKNFLSNIAAGMMLLFQKPFDIGDVIESCGTTGVVDKVDLFSIRIKTFSNELVYIPNGKLAADKIINKNTKQKRRVEVKIGISYNAHVKVAKDLLLGLLKSDPRIMQKPEPTVNVGAFEDSALVLQIQYWVAGKEMSSTKFDFLESTKLAFEQHNIDIPYPQLDVWMKSDANE